MSSLIRRQSPALVIAIIALIAAFGGSALAGGPVNKKKAKKIANNVVTQRAPGLSVAHAASADNATTAGTANKVGSLTPAKFDYRATSDSPTATVATLGNLVLLGECPSGTTDLFADASGATLVFKSSNISEGNDPTDNSDDNLDPGEFIDLNFSSPDAALEEVSGTFDSVSPGGSVATGQFGTEDGELADCQAFGTGFSS
jgi:hypothetical protein